MLIRVKCEGTAEIKSTGKTKLLIKLNVQEREL